MPAKPRTRPGEVVKQTAARRVPVRERVGAPLGVGGAERSRAEPGRLEPPAARERSRKLKLRLKIQYGDGPEGTVLKQSLEAGIAVRPGLPLTLLVGRGGSTS